jgi:hypothetical protein
MQDKPNSSDTTSPSAAISPKNRVKTPGETTFDASTYVVVGIGANEGGSLVAMNLVKEKDFSWNWLNTVKNEWIRPGYQKIQGALNKTPVLRDIDYFSKGRFLYICTCLAGGMAVLFPTKWMEESKGSLVRWFDRHIYGLKPEEDPAVAKLHEEMDHAPKQSWRSLLEGRLTVILAAFGVDVLIGKPDAISTKFFEKTVLKDYSSAERAASSVARNIVYFFDPKGKETRLRAINPTKRYDIQPGEGNAVGRVKDIAFLLTVSVALMTLFYASSKLFAKNIAKKAAHADVVASGAIPADKEAGAEEGATATPKQPAEETSAAQPKTQVSHITHNTQRADTKALSSITAANH